MNDAIIVSDVNTRWKRTTKEEKYYAKYIGRTAKSMRGKKSKRSAATVRQAKRAAQRALKRSVGRRLTPEEMQSCC